MGTETISDSTETGTTRRRSGEETAEAVLDAAELLFAESGYSGTALRDIAERVGIRTPSLYNHFDGKESLYSAVLERGIRPIFNVLAEVVDSPVQDREAAVVAVMKLIAEHPNLPRLVQQETVAGGKRLTPLLTEWIQRLFATAGEMVEGSNAGQVWERQQYPLLVLAMYHIFVGYFTIAPAYKEIGGYDLLSENALERQTRFFVTLVTMVFGDPLGATKKSAN